MTTGSGRPRPFDAVRLRRPVGGMAAGLEGTVVEELKEGWYLVDVDSVEDVVGAPAESLDIVWRQPPPGELAVA